MGITTDKANTREQAREESPGLGSMEERSPLVDSGIDSRPAVFTEQGPGDDRFQDAIAQIAVGIPAPLTVEDQARVLTVIDTLSEARTHSGLGEGVKLEVVTAALRDLYEETALVPVRQAIIAALDKLSVDEPATRALLAREASDGYVLTIRRAASDALSHLSAEKAAAA